MILRAEAPMARCWVPVARTVGWGAVGFPRAAVRCKSRARGDILAWTLGAFSNSHFVVAGPRALLAVIGS